jgi:hypothetical protein
VQEATALILCLHNQVVALQMRMEALEAQRKKKIPPTQTNLRPATAPVQSQAFAPGKTPRKSAQAQGVQASAA